MYDRDNYKVINWDNVQVCYLSALAAMTVQSLVWLADAAARRRRDFPEG